MKEVNPVKSCVAVQKKKKKSTKKLWGRFVSCTRVTFAGLVQFMPVMRNARVLVDYAVLFLVCNI